MLHFIKILVYCFNLFAEYIQARKNIFINDNNYFQTENIWYSHLESYTFVMSDLKTDINLTNVGQSIDWLEKLDCQLLRGDLSLLVSLIYQKKKTN